MVWYSHLFKNFPQFVVIHTVEGFDIVNKADVFLELSCFFDDPTNCGKFFKRWEYQTTWPASWEICVQIKKQQLELDMEQQTGSKLGKECIKAGFCHPAYLTYMQSDNIQPWCTPFLIWNQSVALCPVLTVASWPAYRFLKRQVRWHGLVFPSLEEFSTICSDPHSQRLWHNQ